MAHFIITYQIFLVNVQTNYSNNLLILDVKQIKSWKFITFILWKHCGMARVKLRCIMGRPGLKSSYPEKDLLKRANENMKLKIKIFKWVMGNKRDLYFDPDFKKDNSAENLQSVK